MMRRQVSFFRPTLLLFIGLLLDLFYESTMNKAHAVAPITPSGLNTTVNDPIVVGGKTQYDITGGTRAGTNLFHSFGEFNVPNNNVANFLNEPSNPETFNILGRVTGGNISDIFGTIQTNGTGGFGNANFFLINPAGFLFGSNATVNVGGIVAFSSADYLRLTDAAQFNAIPNATADALLSTEPVVAFGFLGSNPGAIKVHGSQFTVTPGNDISLVGGEITVESGNLSAHSGGINLASVASPGEILAGTLNQTPNVNGQSFGELGDIHVSEKSVLSVSGNGGGTVRIRGGNLIVDDSTISANVTSPGPIVNGLESIGSGIDILATEDAIIRNGAVLETNVLANATPGFQYGGVHINADRIEVRGIADFENEEESVFTTIQSNVASGTTGGGSGAIRVEGDSILIKDAVRIQTQVGEFGATEGGGVGDAGHIIVMADQNLDIETATLESGSFGGASGNAGNIELKSAQGDISVTTFSNVTTQANNSAGNAGHITVSAPRGNVLLADVTDIFNQTFKAGSLGGIEFTANNLTLIGDSTIGGDNLSPLLPRNIEITLSGDLNLRDNSSIQTVARGPIRAADLSISAHDINISRGSFLTTETNSSGTGGQLIISTESFQLATGGQLRSGSIKGPVPDGPVIPSGTGGTITIHGQTGPTQSVLIDGTDSGIITNTEGIGAGGNTILSARNLTIQNGGTISASSTGLGDAGNITISGDSLTIASGGRIEASTSGTGDGGSIGITTTGDVTVTGRSANGPVRSGIFAKTLSASGGSGDGSGGGGGGSGGGSGGGASKPGKAGDITIEAKNLLLNGGAQIDSSTTSGGTGGTVSIRTAENITIAGSSTRLTSDATRGDGKGGNITLVAKNITVRDRASVTAATGGKGDAGNVTLTAPDQLLLQSAGVITTSTSGSGNGGTIAIQAGQVLLDGPGTRITAATLPPFADMTITIDILHPNGGDLVVQLDSPTDTRVALFSRIGGSGDNFTDTQFNDQATKQITSGSAPFTGTFTPREPLGQLINELVAGDWVLHVRDQATDNVGQLESWTLQIGQQTFQSTGGSKVIPDNGSVRSAITVADPTVPTVQGVGKASGTGGDINVLASRMTMDNGATVSTASSGSGNAGNIFIDAGQRFDMQSSSITTQATQASGGNIDIRAVDHVRLVNSVVSSSVQGDPSTAGGNITIDPNVVVLQGSQVIAQAVQGAGGNITITTPLFLADSGSLVSASSQLGVNGTVTIQSPTSNVSGSLGPLTSKPSQAQALLTQRCAALVNGQASSFVVAGREQLPADPGGWLSSPLAFAALGENLDADNAVASISTVMAIPADNTSTVSLRRLTPAGFLMANFAESEATGCRS